MIHLEPAEVLSILRAAKVSGAREWAMIVVAYKHGMRASEVCNLRLDDFDMKNGGIVIRRLKGSLRTTQAMAQPALSSRSRLALFFKHCGRHGYRPHPAGVFIHHHNPHGPGILFSRNQLVERDPLP
jgi:integrase